MICSGWSVAPVYQRPEIRNHALGEIGELELERRPLVRVSAEIRDFRKSFRVYQTRLEPLCGTGSRTGACCCCGGGGTSQMVKLSLGCT